MMIYYLLKIKVKFMIYILKIMIYNNLKILIKLTPEYLVIDDEKIQDMIGKST